MIFQDISLANRFSWTLSGDWPVLLPMRAKEPIVRPFRPSGYLQVLGFVLSSLAGFARNSLPERRKRRAFCQIRDTSGALSSGYASSAGGRSRSLKRPSPQTLFSPTLSRQAERAANMVRNRSTLCVGSTSGKKTGFSNVSAMMLASVPETRGRRKSPTPRGTETGRNRAARRN